MKVLTEQKAKYICNNKDYDYISRKAVEFLLDSSFEEIDQLTVSKLRPMSDAPKDEYILTFNGSSFTPIIVRDNYPVGIYHKCEGWIPMPIYKPEDK